MQNLPVNGRNFIDFALLTPGVTRDVRTGDISFAGQRGTLNSLVIDGADNNNTFFGQTLGRTGSGRAPYQFSQDAVQEFQVNSNAYSAEYGRAGGAVINVVTKSGTNDAARLGVRVLPRQGAEREQRDQRAEQPAQVALPLQSVRRHARRPDRRDRDFFFVNYDGQRNTQPNTVFLNLPADHADRSGDARPAIARLRPLAESWERGSDQDVFLDQDGLAARPPAQRLTLRYNHQNFTGEEFENGGPQNALEHTGASNVRTRTFNATFTRGVRHDAVQRGARPVSRATRSRA